VSYKVDTPTKIKLHPWASCNDCSWDSPSGPHARTWAKMHVRGTGHDVLVVMEERTLYGPAEQEGAGQ